MSRIPVNPKLPKNFDCTPNEERPASHKRWWYRPYIVTCDGKLLRGPERSAWLKSWPSGTRYDVRCLDGGAWDRSTWCGSYETLEEAITRAWQIRHSLKEEGFA